VLAVALALLTVGEPAPQVRPAVAATAVPSLPSPAPGASAELAIAVPQAPANLPTLDYFKPAPRGFPADTSTQSIEPVGQALRPAAKLAAYDAPGGKALAYLDSTISGVPLVVPIVDERAGWRAVLLPSVNRKIGWVPPTGWEPVPLHDLLIIHRKAHTLTWLRDDALYRTWKVGLGTRQTPTPLGRTFVLARSKLKGRVYAGADVLALGAVPDAGLRGAHIGIHAWYDPSVVGRDVSDGCIRLPLVQQKQLLDQVGPGTPVVVQP
jgi:hypothetical protein